MSDEMKWGRPKPPAEGEGSDRAAEKKLPEWGSSPKENEENKETAGKPQEGDGQTGGLGGGIPPVKGNTGASQGEAGDRRIPPRYSHYQIDQSPSQQQMNNRPPYKKKGGNGGKFATAAGLAVVFGLVAGLVFQGVNYASDFLRGDSRETNTQVSMAEAVTGKAAASDQDSGSASNGGTVAEVAQAAMPAVVAITSVSIQEIPSFFSQFGFGSYVQEYPSTGSGSGIIVGENNDELLIATNNHVVEGATTLSVCFMGNDVVNAELETQNIASGDGDINVEDAVTAKIKGNDSDNDLAVVAVKKEDIPADTLEQIKIAKIGNSDELLVGEQVVAIGNALGYGQSVTSGWVSALNRTMRLENGESADLIQTDAAINPGNSGGALLNMRGELIGINSAKTAGNVVEGMGYAIPISKAKPILEELMNRVTRDKAPEAKAGRLGIQMAYYPEETAEMYNMPKGAFIIEVEPGMAAEDAGIKENDIIVKFDGQTISNRDELMELVSYYEAGETVEIVVARADNGDYREITLETTLSSKES